VFATPTTPRYDDDGKLLDLMRDDVNGDIEMSKDP